MNKKIIIGIVSALILIGICFFVFRNPKNKYQDDLKRLDSVNKVLEKKRDSLYDSINVLNTKFITFKQKDSILEFQILNLNDVIAKDKEIANKTQQELIQLKSNIDATKAQISNAKQHPINRDGNSLLESLKIKLQQ